MFELRAFVDHNDQAYLTTHEESIFLKKFHNQVSW